MNASRREAIVQQLRKERARKALQREDNSKQRLLRFTNLLERTQRPSDQAFLIKCCHPKYSGGRSAFGTLTCNFEKGIASVTLVRDGGRIQDAPIVCLETRYGAFKKSEETFSLREKSGGWFKLALYERAARRRESFIEIMDTLDADTLARILQLLLSDEATL